VENKMEAGKYSYPTVEPSLSIKVNGNFIKVIT
jgi:hypothetical protein